MRIIDFHTHFFPDKLFNAIWRWFESNAWPILYQKYSDDLIALLKVFGVTRAVALFYPHKPEMAQSLNRWMDTLARRHRDFIIPFGSIHPDDPDKEAILKASFEDYGFRGIKIHCHVQRVAPDDVRMETVYKICEGYGKIMLIHCGTGPHLKERGTRGYGYDVTTVSGIRCFERVLRRYPRLTFVVPHLGYDEIESFIQLLEDYPNLYLDTSMAMSGFFKVDLKREWFVKYADRILFGTDFPSIPHEWKTEQEVIQGFKLGESIEEKIFYSNAERILNIEDA